MRGTELALFDLPVPPRIRRGLAPERHQVRKPKQRGGLPKDAPTKNACPSPGCPVWIPARFLACSTHWQTLPRQLRRDLDATYRKDVRRHLELFRQAVRLLGAHTLREAHQ